MSLYDQIPGLMAEMEREQATRQISLLDTIILCGIPCRQLSIRTHTLLDGMGSPFVVPKGVPSAEDVAVYLWLHCLEYKVGNEKARLRWVKKNVRPLVKAGKYGWMVNEINQHLSNTFMDSPGQGNSYGTQYFLGSAALLDSICAEYGWTDEYAMGLPICRLFQYQRAMVKRYNPKANLSNPSDRLKSKHLQDRMAAASAQN